MDLYEHKSAIMWEAVGCEDCRVERYAAEGFDGVGVELVLSNVSQFEVAGIGFTSIPG